MKKLGNIFFYILIVISTSIATFFVLDMISDNPVWLNIFPKKTNIDTTIDTHIDQSIEDIVQDIDSHNVAVDYDLQLDELCKSDYNICSIISIMDSTKTLTSKNIYYYHVLVAYVLKKVWSYGYEDVLDHLQLIEINSKSHKSRWYASAHSVNLNLWLMLSYTEFYKVFTHEFGHTFDLWYILGSSRSLDPKYTEFGRKIFSVDDPSIWFYAISRDDEYTLSSDSSYKDFVSWYGMSDIFEDFAETYNFYLNYHDVFASIAKESPKLQAKYDYMQSLFNSNYFKTGKEKLKSFENKEFRPYDTTRF